MDCCIFMFKKETGLVAEFAQALALAVRNALIRCRPAAYRQIYSHMYTDTLAHARTHARTHTHTHSSVCVCVCIATHAKRPPEHGKTCFTYCIEIYTTLSLSHTHTRIATEANHRPERERERERERDLSRSRRASLSVKRGSKSAGAT